MNGKNRFLAIANKIIAFEIRPGGPVGKRTFQKKRNLI